MGSATPTTNTSTGHLNYDLPFGHGRHFGNNSKKAVNAVPRDWHYDTIVTVHGGLPIWMIQFGYDPTGAYFQPRPDCNSASVATPYKNFVGDGYVWFDPTTMSIPGQVNSETVEFRPSAGLESSKST